MLRADSHDCTPEVLRVCRAHKLHYVLGVAPTSTLREHTASLEQSTAARLGKSSGEKLRRFTQFHDGAKSWDCVERIIARVEAGPEGTDTRFIVTSLRGIRGCIVYEKIYCARGQAENHIKSWKTHLAADRTSCTRADRQPDAAVSACRRLLADVELAQLDAAALVLACRAVRHVCVCA